MNIRVFTVGPVACNCCVVVCPQTQEAAVIDPGGHAERVLSVVKSLQVRVTQIWITHGHFDHILGVGEVSAVTGAGVSLHTADQELYENLSRQGLIFGFEATDPPKATRLLSGGETLSLGSLSAKVLSTPGHTPGSVGYYFEGEKPVLFSGDTLFADSIGRTDFTGGSPKDIEKSIRDTLYVLPGETRVIPGHGGETTIAHERQHNPFVRA